MVGSFPQEDKTDIAATTEAAEIGVRTKTVPKYKASTSSAPPLVYSIPPIPQGMPPRVIMIS